MRHTHFHDTIPDPCETQSDLTSHPLTGVTTALSVTGARVDDVHAQVSAEGLLDLATVHLLTSVLDAQLRLGRRHVRADLTRVTVADVGCLRELRGVNDRFLAAHGLLVLDPVTDDLQSLLRITGLDRELAVTLSVSPPEASTSGRQAGRASLTPGSPAAARRRATRTTS